MAENSEISWTDHTHNEWIGCTRVSPGCQHCYAETLMDTRYGRVKWGKGQPRVLTAEANRRKPLAWDRAAAKTGVRPRVFSASLSDWLDHEVDPAWLAGLLATVEATPELDWLLLTKRPQQWESRIRAASAVAHQSLAVRDLVYRWLNGTPPLNVWVGTTVEDQERADLRVPQLLTIPARVRFLSCEPLLGPLDVARFLADPAEPFRVGLRNGSVTHGAHPWSCRCGCREPAQRIHWIIAGGESGHGARPMHPAWGRSLRDQATSAAVAFHFKQWGEWLPTERPADLDSIRPHERDERWMNAAGGHGFHGEDVWRMKRVGKKAAGRLLDGREWNEFPVTAAVLPGGAT